MEISRIQGPLVALMLLVAQAALAQDSPVFVRRSGLPTPPVLDVEVLRQQRVGVPAVAILSNPQQSAVLQLDLFADVSFRAVRERLEPTAHGMSWVGVLDGYPESDAIFVLVEDELIGHIWTPFGFFRIERQRDGGYLVQQVAQTGASTDVRVLPESDGSIVPNDRSSSRDDRWSTRADDGSVIDILVTYTSKALEGFGSEARALATIDMLIAETNQAFVNSRIPIRLRLVHTTLYEVVPGHEDKDAASDVLRNRPGSPSEVLAKRDYYGADLVSVIAEQLYGGLCGAAFGRNIKETLENGGHVQLPFTEIRRDCTGYGHTFSHEIGHNLGARHDWYASGSIENWNCEENPGQFKDICPQSQNACIAAGSCRDYAHGFVNLPGRFQDLMSSSGFHCAAARVTCTTILHYSNPRVTYSGRSTGVPAGTKSTCKLRDLQNTDCDADNSRMITELAPRIARYKDSRTALGNRQLLSGRAMRSENRRYRLVYPTDGNLVLYDDREGTALWATRTGGTSPGQAILQTDGNFVVYDKNGAALWASHTGGNPNAYFVIQDDGNFVIYSADGQPLWSRMQEASQ